MNEGNPGGLKKEHRTLRRRPLFTPLLMPLFGGIAAVLLLAWAWNASSTTTVVLVRHAEKLAEPPDDPPLSPEGQHRAKALAGWMADSGVQTIYVSQFRRTRETAEPVAKRTGAEIVALPADDLSGVMKQLRGKHRGETVLVVGHSNTIPALIEWLGGDGVEIDENDFSRLFVVTDSPLTQTTVLALRYGG